MEPGTASIGIRELRGGLAGAVRRAGAGERLLVTVDGRPVARLGPIESGPTPAALADLVAAGLVHPPARPDRPPAPPPVPLPVDVRLAAVLAEVRGGASR